MQRNKAELGYFALFALTCLALAMSLYNIFAVAPVEMQMGIVQKVFYFHVPSAYAMYVGFVVCALASVAYLVRRAPRWDAIAVAAAEIGVAFCAIVLTTGPLWARKAWGVYWTWDPRLTSTLLAGMIYISFIALRSSGSAGDIEKRFAAGLALVGLPVIVIIHESVKRWRGQHPTVISQRGGGLDPDMVPALLWSFAAFTLLVTLMIWSRVRVERARQKLAELEIEAARQGLLEDS